MTKNNKLECTSTSCNTSIQWDIKESKEMHYQAPDMGKTLKAYC